MAIKISVSMMAIDNTVTCVFMPYLTYLPSAYPEYAASVLASNDFVRRYVPKRRISHSLLC
jgi:hypothetical protein